MHARGLLLLLLQTESAFVVFTDDPAKRFEEFTDADFSRTDANLGIKYENDEIFEDTVLLLRYNCPDRTCDVACLGWPDLHRHVKSKHGKVMWYVFVACVTAVVAVVVVVTDRHSDLCTRNKKVFTHEHELFSAAALRRHERDGDDMPGAINQSGFRGHPECGFCRQRFYGDDELYAHCRDRHERCHICDRRSAGRQQQYYIDYNALEDHFQKDHFLCLDKDCLEKKFVVFESQLDLKAHQLESHPNGLSKDARRDARTVDLSDFAYRTPYQPPPRSSNRRAGAGAGAGRGRDPNAEPLPASSAQPLRRDEIAYQRQMAIQSAQSVSTRSFGGQLTRHDTQTVQAPERPALASGTSTPTAGGGQAGGSRRVSPSPLAAGGAITTTAELDSLRGRLSLDPTSAESSGAPPTPQEQARRLRHAAVIERASNLLRNDALQLSEFRSRVSQYRQSAISATELIDAFFSLFDTSSAELGKLIKELADIYEEEPKRSSLLKAWNDWRAINEDYPALPGSTGMITSAGAATAGTSSGSTGKRVLRLKSSTAQSSRSAVGRNGALSSSAAATNFPPLSSSSSSAAAAAGGRRNQTGITPWRVQSSAPVSSSSSAGGTSSTARTASSASASSASSSRRQAGASAEAFPALPAAPKPNVMIAGLTRGTVRWDDNRRPGGTAVSSRSNNPWGAGAAAKQADSDADAEPAEPDSLAGAKKGKGKKGKQTLFHFG